MKKLSEAFQAENWPANHSLASVCVLSGAVLAGCDSTIPVRVDIPLARFDTPTVANKVVGVQVAYLQANSLELTPDVAQTNPDPQNPTLKSSNSDSNSQTVAVSGSVALASRHRLSVFRNDIFGDAPNGLKYQFQFLGPTWPDIEPGAITASIVAAVGYNEIEEDDEGRQADYHQIMQDIGLVFGGHLSNQIALYGGPYYTEHRYYGQFSQPGNNAAQKMRGVAIVTPPGGGGGDGGGDMDDGDPAPTVTDLRGEVRIRGGVAGMAIYPTRNLDMTILLEVNRANIESGNLDEYETSTGASFRFAFGG